MHKTTVRLADGRRLHYFDDAAGVDRTAPDRRAPVPVDARSSLRRDPFGDEWVVIAAHRQERTHLPPATECPLCPTAPGRSTEIPAPDYDVAVFENRFPALGGAASGRCEVVCFTSDHGSSFSALGGPRLATLAGALVDRTAELSTVPGVRYVFCFENRGEEIGVTLEHPHGQIYAYPFVPPRILRSLQSARRYAARTGGCLHCATVAAAAGGERVVAATDRFVAFVPDAPRWPFEVHTYARAHVPDLASLPADELDELFRLQADVLARFDGLFTRPVPYVSGWIQAPVAAYRRYAHLHAQTFSPRRSATKLKYLAGSESAAGAYIVDIEPERAAELLRRAGPDGPDPGAARRDREGPS